MTRSAGRRTGEDIAACAGLLPVPPLCMLRTMTHRMLPPGSGLLAFLCMSALLRGWTAAGEVIPIWPESAPGETGKAAGTPLPVREADNPPITRVAGITYPTMEVFLPAGATANGVAVLILPGGGFRYVVPDLEGSEAGAILNAAGITVFVLHYRTTEDGPDGAWRKPLQDAQRAIRHIRHHAARWKLDPGRVGLLAFSAGGQVGAIHIGDSGDAYEAVDAVDRQSARPDFALLVYPWRVTGADGALMPEIRISPMTPPTFLVHTHDDASTSIGAALLYAALHQHKVEGELHIYQNGGHGYGVRQRPDSNIGSWSARAVDWLRVRGLAGAAERK